MARNQKDPIVANAGVMNWGLEDVNAKVKLDQTGRSEVDQTRTPIRIENTNPYRNQWRMSYLNRLG